MRETFSDYVRSVRVADQVGDAVIETYVELLSGIEVRVPGNLGRSLGKRVTVTVEFDDEGEGEE